MDEQIARTIRRTKTLAEIAQLERDLVKRNFLTDEIGRAIHERKRELARALIAQKTGLVLEAPLLWRGMEVRRRRRND